MANLNYVTKNIYTKAADKSEKSSRTTALILGSIISILFLIITPVLGIIIFFVALLIAINAGKYKTIILRSGATGENYVLSILSELPDQYYLFNQVIVPNHLAKRGFNEIDVIVSGINNIFIVEAKNHKGHITGHENDYQWDIYRVGRRGTPYTKKMYNPLKQVTNQSYALKRHLESKGLSTSIIPIAVFTNPECSYEISSTEKLAYILLAEDLIKFVLDYDSNHINPGMELVLSELINLKNGRSNNKIETKNQAVLNRIKQLYKRKNLQL